VGIAVLILGVTGQGDDTKAEGSWPLFRGNPQQTGVAPASLPDQLKILWQFKADTKDGIEGTAAIANGTVFIGSFDSHLYAIDLKSGKEKWRYKAAPFKATPGYRDGVIYIGDEDGNFHAVDAVKGTKRWTYKAESAVVSGTGFSGDDLLFGTEGEQLICLSKDGKKRWDFKVAGGPVQATPAVSGGYTFVAGCDSNLHVIETKTGKEVRAVDLGGQVGSTGALSGNMLYVGTMGSNEVHAIDWKEGKIVWTFKPKRAQPFYASVALTDELVIAGCQNRRVYGINRKSGQETWSFLTEGRIDSSPVVVGKRVYVGSTDGWFYVLDRDKGSLVQKIDLKDDIVGSPAVAGGRLIIATVKGTVYCLGD
jgi:outer membrane protein assembly factor BamB